MKSKNLKDVLRNTLPEDALQIVVRGYDVIGDICVIIIPDDILRYEKTIAAAVMQAAPSVRVVAKRVGKYTGEFRTLSLKKIGGKGDLETLHKEYGIRLYVNPEKVYFSPRSAGERFRIAKSVVSGERVLVMFCGIAPLPLMIAKHSRALEVYGVEKNTAAHHYGILNLAANKKVKNVHLFNGDVAEIVPELKTEYDRIAMPLPLSAGQYVQIALKVLKSKGTLHFYDFKKKKEFHLALKELQEKCALAGREVLESSIIKCGHVSPGKYRLCVDARIA